MTDTAECRRCHRRLLSDWAEVGLGPKCAARLGLVRAKRARAVRPVRVEHPEQPSLLDLLEVMDMENTNSSPVTVCRCPAGWPINAWRVSRGDNTWVREHHRNLCGLPDEAVGTDA